MLLSMDRDPIVFAMANPNPEIAYELAMATRSDLVMATGRSDYPNQINNVLGFPSSSAAMDVRSRIISEGMKMAAAKALADLTKEPVPDSVAKAYGGKKFTFGREYIVPKPFDPGSSNGRRSPWRKPPARKAWPQLRSPIGMHTASR